jgi:hypothetical protein
MSRLTGKASLLLLLGAIGCESLLGVDFDRAHIADDAGADVASGGSGGSAGAGTGGAAGTAGVAPDASADADADAPENGDAGGDAPDGCSVDGAVACYDGPAGTAGVGLCKTGLLTCSADVLTCEGQVTPVFEDPTTAADDSCDGYTGNYLSNLQFGASGTQRVDGFGLDSAGNMFVVGTFYGTFTIGSDTLTSAGGADIYLAKLDSQGNGVWAKSFGSADQEAAAGLVVDGLGNVIISGEIIGPTDFGDGVHTPLNGQYTAYLAKFDTNGNIAWSGAWGNAVHATWGYAVAVGPSNEVMLAGAFRESLQFGSTPPLVGAVGDVGEAYLAVFDSSGTPLFSRGFIAPGQQLVVQSTIDANGNLYVTGTTDDVITVAGGSIGAPGKNAFVAVFDPTGSALWSQPLGPLTGTSGYSVGGVAVDAQGNVAVTTTYVGTTTLGSTQHTSVNGSQDILVAELDSSGNFLWSQSFGDATDDENPRRIAVDSLGNVVVAGNVRTQLSCGGKLLPYSGGDDVFVLKLSQAGDPLWCQVFGGSGMDAVNAVRTNAANQVLAAGAFESSMNLGTDALVSLGGTDALIVKFEP